MVVDSIAKIFIQSVEILDLFPTGKNQLPALLNTIGVYVRVYSTSSIKTLTFIYLLAPWTLAFKTALTLCCSPVPQGSNYVRV